MTGMRVIGLFSTRVMASNIIFGHELYNDSEISCGVWQILVVTDARGRCISYWSA